MNSRITISLTMFLIVMTMLGNTESVLGRTDVLEQSFKRKEKVMNSSDEIALTVSANGTSKDEATKIALRSAIEQAYGAFVSSNTTILDDELIKDEIVTISKGNIKSYKEVASAILPNGLNTVTLQAVVSISNLVSYAKSKGASAEFSGASFGMGMKIKELNKENEMIALNNLLEQVRALVPTSFNKELIIEEPQVTSTEDFLKYFNTNYRIDYQIKMEDVIASFARFDIVDPNRNRFSLDNKKKLFLEQWISSADNSYLMKLSVNYKHNRNTKLLLDLISSTLKSIALTKEEVDEYKRQNIPISPLTFSTYSMFWEEKGRTNRAKGDYYKLRSTPKDLDSWAEELKQIFAYDIADFKIVDNLGVESSFDSYTITNMENLIYDYKQKYGKEPHFLNDISCNRCFKFSKYMQEEYVGHCIVEGKGLFNGALVKLLGCPEWNSEDFTLKRLPFWEVIFLIEKDDIMKYNNFRIERKN